MSRLVLPLRELLEDHADEVALERVWRRVEQDPRRVHRRVQTWRLVTALAACAAGLVAVVALVHRPAGAESGALRLADASRADLAQALAAGARALALSDGSQLTLDAEAKLEVLESSGQAVSLILSGGRATFDVKPGGRGAGPSRRAWRRSRSSAPASPWSAPRGGSRSTSNVGWCWCAASGSLEGHSALGRTRASRCSRQALRPPRRSQLQLRLRPGSLRAGANAGGACRSGHRAPGGAEPGLACAGARRQFRRCLPGAGLRWGQAGVRAPSRLAGAAARPGRRRPALGPSGRGGGAAAAHPHRAPARSLGAARRVHPGQDRARLAGRALARRRRLRDRHRASRRRRGCSRPPGFAWWRRECAPGTWTGSRRPAGYDRLFPAGQLRQEIDRCLPAAPPP